MRECLTVQGEEWLRKTPNINRVLPHACAHMHPVCPHIHVHRLQTHTHTNPLPHKHTPAKKKRRICITLKLYLSKKDSLGYRELTTRRVGERLKERGKGEWERGDRGRRREETEGSGTLDNKLEAYYNKTYHKTTTKKTLKKLVYNKNCQKPKHQSSWLNLPHLQLCL